MGFLPHCHLSPLVCNNLHILVDTFNSSSFPIQIQEHLIFPCLVYNIWNIDFFFNLQQKFSHVSPLNSALIFLSVNINSQNLSSCSFLIKVKEIMSRLLWKIKCNLLFNTCKGEYIHPNVCNISFN